MSRPVFRAAAAGVLLLAATRPTTAAGLTDRDLVIPVAARTPGLLGTLWRTDLVVTNTSRDPFQVPVQITFMSDTGPPQTHFLSLGPMGSLVLPDVVRDAYGHEQAFGLIRITSGDPDARFVARARIVDVGGREGEYGQGVAALPTPALPLRSVVSGLSGVDGNRTNLGLANPHPAEAQVFLDLWGPGGSQRGGLSLGVAPRSVLQLNDIFFHFGITPFANATVEITSTVGLYAYASVVRNDTGDAVFAIASGEAPETPFDILEPECAEPAPLALAQNPGNGWVVSLHPEFDPSDTATELSDRYGFSVITVFGSGFVAALAAPTVAALRCEAAVERLDQTRG